LDFLGFGSVQKLCDGLESLNSLQISSNFNGNSSKKIIKKYGFLKRGGSKRILRNLAAFFTIVSCWKTNFNGEFHCQKTTEESNLKNNKIATKNSPNNNRKSDHHLSFIEKCFRIMHVTKFRDFIGIIFIRLANSKKFFLINKWHEVNGL
jgi:hypothetical protein